MYKRSKARASILVGASTIVYAFCVVACSDSPNTLSTESVVSGDQAIINGAVPARGSEQWRGVVHVSRPSANGTMANGTGTLLTNRHVLTARHVVADWLDPGWGTAPAPSTFSIRLDGATWATDQTVTASAIYQPNTTQGLGAADYSIIELSSPMVFAGVTDGFSNKISDYSDSQFAGRQGYCLGYGINTEAIVWSPLSPNGALTSGAGTLRTATFTLSSGGAGTFLINRQTNAGGLSIIPGPGDSGGTCFVDGAVTGVASWCHADGAEIDGTGGITSSEWTKINLCVYASPDSFRNWVSPLHLADVGFGYDFVPALASGTVVTADIYVPNSSFKNSIVSTASGQSIATFAPRSGFIRVEVPNEPANMMCPILKATSPMSGTASLRGTCLSDGIIPTVSSTILM